MNEHLDRSHEKSSLRVSPEIRHGMVALESQGEALRNRLLRRVDWRFLAGTPQPARSFVPGGGMLAQALALVSDEVITEKQVPPCSVDVAALINPDRGQVERAWEGLKPGGALYGEWYYPVPGGVSFLRRRLSKLGFLIAGSYWPWPWPERGTPAFWLPLDAPAALQYFLESRPPVHRFLARILRRVLQFTWRLGYRLGMLAPVCMVAHKPLDRGDTRWPPGSLVERTHQWGLGENGAGMAWLLLTGGLHSTNKVTGLVFRPKSKKPDYVVKMPRRELSLPSLEREAEVLSTLQADQSRPLPGVPELVFLETQNDFPAIGETHLEGTPLYSVMQHEEIETLAHKGTLWLTGLVEPGMPQPPSNWLERLAAPVLEDFERGYAIAGIDRLLEAIKGELASLGPLRLAVEHRDFSPWNVFLNSSGDLAILDWEGAEPHGLPVCDLVYFLAYLTFFTEGSL
jgi:hypothetical protein